MFQRVITGLAFGVMVFGASTAWAVDGKGLTDGSVYDHKGVSPYEPKRTGRGDHRRAAPPPDDDYTHVKRCYWTVKTTDGWWPTGATQVCFREKIN